MENSYCVHCTHDDSFCIQASYPVFIYLFISSWSSYPALSWEISLSTLLCDALHLTRREYIPYLGLMSTILTIHSTNIPPGT